MVDWMISKHREMELQMAQTSLLEQIKLSIKQTLEESTQRIINTLCGKKADPQLYEQSTKQEREDIDGRSSRGDTGQESSPNKEGLTYSEDTEETGEALSNLSRDRLVYKSMPLETLLEKGHTPLEMSVGRCCEQGGPQGELRRETRSHKRGHLIYDKEKSPLRWPGEIGRPQRRSRKGSGFHIRGQPKLSKEDEGKRSISVIKNSKGRRDFKKRKKASEELGVVAL